MAGPDSQIVIPDPNSIASQFASKVQEIFSKQRGIAGTENEMAEKVFDDKNVKIVQNAKNVKEAGISKNMHDPKNTLMGKSGTVR